MRCGEMPLFLSPRLALSTRAVAASPVPPMMWSLERRGFTYVGAGTSSERSRSVHDKTRKMVKYACVG
ncbi:unnamed protein product [Dibothriocephalus latus]|uniref:Uncharacterized protein n=1 Tax=Dibothriocephalus latus TaxID=60516 RepID=A0A3P6PVB5_DIBLA|nr:unnamed protein product [Dibothriocephalus latus]